MKGRRFYVGLALVMALTVFVGFGSTYYVEFLSGVPKKTFGGLPVTPLVHLHAALFTSWVLLFVVQTALVASRRVALHRRLGIAGALLAAGMLVAGTRTAIAAAKAGGGPPGADPLEFLAIPLFDMVTFAIFVTTALVFRRDKEAHKRLMLLAYVSIITAAVARIPGLLPLGPPVFFGLSLLFLAAGVVHDWVSRKHVHRVYLWGGALLVASIPARLLLAKTGAWRALAEGLTR